MRWKDIMNPKKAGVKSNTALPADGRVADLNYGEIPTEDVVVRVVDEQGICIGSVQKELLEYLHCANVPGLFVSILDKLDEAVIAIDQDGRIFYVNPAYNRILGVSLGKVLGRYLQQVEPGSALLTVLQPPHTPVTKEKQLIKSIHKYVSIHAYPLFLRGKFKGAVSVFTDTTRLNELDQEVERISQVAEEFSRQLEVENTLNKIQIVGQSKSFVNSINRAVTAAKADAPVLLRGENGVGKEVFSRILRENSPRKDKPFITVNCSAIPESLIESELFGYEEGAFTGAKKGGSMGKFQLAQGGTLFLDEIGDMPMAMQAKLLRVLQEGEIEKIGRQQNIPVDVRVIAATNQPLEEMMETNRFRRDLYYRLNVVSIHIPPLRERGNDILQLADHFLSAYNQKYDKRLRISSEVYQQFLQYQWPGNVRELENAIESIVVLCQNEVIQLEDLPEQIAGLPAVAQEVHPQVLPPNSELPQGSLTAELAAYERTLIANALTRCNGNRNYAMKELGISRRTFYRKLSQYNLN